MPDLHLVNIKKQYPGKNIGEAESAFSLTSVDISVREGEFFAMLGPSGCGKTTLLKLVAGLLTPDQGEVRLGSENISHLPAEERGFGMVFQEALLFPHMTVEDNVAFGLKMQGVGRKERRKQAVQMLEKVDLAGYGSRYPAELSRGQRQRVSLARAIVSRPKLLLMDEPFSALDPGLRGEMRELVGRMHKEFAMTILFVTHDRDEAFLLADRIAVMKNGKVLQVAAPRDLYENPNGLEVARFMGSGNILEGKIKEGYFHSSGFQLRWDHYTKKSEQQHGWLIIRPESCSIMIDNEEKKNRDDSCRCRMAGKVTDISFRQGLFQVQVQIGAVSFDVLEKSSVMPTLQMGENVSIEFDIRQTRFIPKLH